MTTNGVDYAWWRPGSAGALGGYTFVCRYLSHDPSKNLSLAEAQELTSWDKVIVANWESSGTGGDHAQGVADATLAKEQAAACGMPAGRPIYFSIDEDVSPDTQLGYFQGINTVLPAAQVGVYGSAAMIQYLVAQGVAKWGWRTMSTGWSGGSSTKDCQLEQTGGNNNYDTNVALAADYGGWQVGKVVDNAPPVVPPAPVNKNTPSYRASHNSYTPVAVDGDLGPATTKAMQYVLGTSADGTWGPVTTKDLQSYLHVSVDGVLGPQTVRALQAHVGAAVDGSLGPQTVRDLQSALNAGNF